MRDTNVPANAERVSLLALSTSVRLWARATPAKARGKTREDFMVMDFGEVL
jgi:hypothetical protein